MIRAVSATCCLLRPRRSTRIRCSRSSAWSRWIRDERGALARILQAARRRSSPRCSIKKTSPDFGNIYVCEALHRARLSPLRIAGSLAASGKPLKALERLSTLDQGGFDGGDRGGGSSCATTDRPMVLLAISNIIFGSTIARTRPVQRPAARSLARVDASGPFDVLLSRLSEIGHAPSETS